MGRHAVRVMPQAHATGCLHVIRALAGAAPYRRMTNVGQKRSGAAYAGVPHDNVDLQGDVVSELPRPQQVGMVRAAIDEIVSGDAYRLVGAYYNPTPRDYGNVRRVLFVGRYFDELPGNDMRTFTVGDLAAASLLDVRFGPHTVQKLLLDRECNSILAAIPSEVALWDAADEDLDQNSAACRLWSQLVSIPGVATTRASKLLARKRPHLMPILDSVILKHLRLDGLDAWQSLREALTPDARARIDKLGPAATDHEAKQPSTLRLLDVATWMTHSQSKQAKAVRNFC